jgi:hypothetical protein
MNFVENPAFLKKGKNPERQCLSLADVYKDFRAKKLGIKVRAQEFKNICQDFMVMVHEAMVKEGFEFNPRCNIGRFSIRQRKIRFDRKLRVDFYNTRLERERTGDPTIIVRHLNTHTSNYFYYHHWKKGKCPGIMMWAFKATFENKRAIPNAEKEGLIKPYKPIITPKSKVIR